MEYNKNGTIEQIELINTYEDGLQLCEVTMDDFSSYKIFGDYNDLLKYSGKQVEFSTRPDIINGLREEIVSTIAERSIVSMVDINDKSIIEDDSSLTLIPNKTNVVDVITFDSLTLKKEDVALAQIILVVDYKDGKSQKGAKWKDFTCLDKNSRAFNLRLFTNDSNVDEFAKNIIGHYAMVDIKNTPYGLQVHNDFKIYDQEVQIPPEAQLASLTLNVNLREDKELKEYVEKYDLINKLKTMIYYEPGYHLVEMSAELILINAICRIFEGYDKKLLKRAVFASRGCLLSANTKLSKDKINYHRIITSSLKNDVDLIRLLDQMSGVEEGDINKSAYLNIRQFISTLMRERRGLLEESKINNLVNSINSEYGWLF